MAASSRPSPFVGPWEGRAQAVDEWMAQHKTVVSATTASLVSTFAGFPLDSLKSRLQSSREAISIPRLAADVIREEGVGGLWRGFPLPLMTISIVRTISFTIYTSSKRIINATPSDPTTSANPWLDVRLGLFNSKKISDVAITSGLAGAASGAVVCLGSAPFELVKVRRQLEYQIWRDTQARGAAAPPSSLKPASTLPPTPFQPPSTIAAVRSILRTAGPLGLYTGFRLHFVRDTFGTALYFAEYDVLRHVLGRVKGEQGELPDWAQGLIPKSTVPFMCGSLAGVTSWALIYPVDAIKTKAQQRALSGLSPRTPTAQFLRLVRGTDAANPKPLLVGIGRLYRGLGVSMIRSMLTHGLLWTLVDLSSGWIDTKPFTLLVRSSQE